MNFDKKTHKNSYKGPLSITDMEYECYEKNAVFLAVFVAN
jgi:hypothetical protein